MSSPNSPLPPKRIIDLNGNADVAMDQSCADYWYKSFEDFKADGGKVDGIVEWISDPDAAKQVSLVLPRISGHLFARTR